MRLNKLTKKLTAVVAVIALTIGMFPELTGDEAPKTSASSFPLSMNFGTNVLKNNAGFNNSPTVWFGLRQGFYDNYHNSTKYSCQWNVIAYDGKDGNGNYITYTDENDQKIGLYDDDAITLLIRGKTGQDSKHYFNVDDESNQYNGSSMMNAINAFYYDVFDSRERSSIKTRVLQGSDSNKVLDEYDLNTIKGPSVDNAYFWPLSEAEAWNLPENIAGMTDYVWWLRSPGYCDSDAGYYCNLNIPYKVDYAYVREYAAIKPACYLKKENVLFTCDSVYGKLCPSVGKDSLTGTIAATSNDWIITLKDDGSIPGLNGHQNFSINPDMTKYDEKTKTVTAYYSGATTGINEYISAIIVNKDNEITYYGKLAVASPEGNSPVSVNIDGKLNSGDKLYIYNEKVNESMILSRSTSLTDYASSLIEIPIPQWEFRDFSWIGDETNGYTAAKANFECTNYSSQVKSVDAIFNDETINPTCTESGKSDYTASILASDSPDGKDHIAYNSRIIPPTGHDMQFLGFSWTGNVKNGYTKAIANYQCKYDSKHTNTAEAELSSKIIGPFCAENGHTEYTALITAENSPDGLDHIETKNGVETDPVGHKWRFKGFTWTGDAATGYSFAVANYQCETDSEHKKTVDATIVENVTKVSCSQDGKTEYIATVYDFESLDGKEHTATKYALEKNASGHTWEFINFSWIGDEKNGYIAATANYRCKNNSEHTDSIELDLTEKVTSPTCTEDGITSYSVRVTAENSLDGKVHSDVKYAKPVQANGHKWKNATCTEPKTCTECGKTEGYPKDHDWGEWITVSEATETTTGEMQRVCKNDPTHVDKMTIPVVIPSASPVPKETEAPTTIPQTTDTPAPVPQITPSAVPQIIPSAVPQPTAPADNKVTNAVKTESRVLPGVKVTSNGKKNLKVTWSKVKGVSGYEISYALCNHKKKTAGVTNTASANNKKTSYKIGGLKANTAYYVCVNVYVLKNGIKEYVKTSPIMHALTSGGDKRYTNVKNVTVTNASITLNAGSSTSIKAGVSLSKKGKKIMPAIHAPKLRYLSTDTSVATVSGKGQITGVAAGKCEIYVYAHNGEFKKVNVTVN